MARKKIIGVTTIILLCTILPIISFFLKKTEPEGKITAFFHLYSYPVNEYLANKLIEFDNAYPGIELEYAILPYLDMKRGKKQFLESLSPSGDGEEIRTRLEENNQIIISAQLINDIAPDEHISPGSWTGTEWKIYYHEPFLNALGLTTDDLEKVKKYSIDQFTDYFSSHIGGNQTIFAASSQFYIQWLSWIQHIALMENKGKMPKDFSLETWQPSIDLFKELVSRDYINQDHGEINEATAAFRMYNGEALFVLSTDSIYSLFTPDKWSNIKSIPFPGSHSQNWHVGSGFYLTTKSPQKPNRALRAAERVFIDFLRSDEVITDFLRDVDIKLNPEMSWNSKSREIPSISDMVNQSPINELIDYKRF